MEALMKYLTNTTDKDAIQSVQDTLNKDGWSWAKATIDCSCNDPAHMMVFNIDFERHTSPLGETILDKESTISYQLNTHLPWYKRIVVAFKYLFNIADRRSAWHDVFLDDNGIKELKKTIRVYDEVK